MTAFAPGNPAQGRYVVGWSDGTALVFGVRFPVSYRDDQRVVTPTLDYPLGETPLVVDAAEAQAFADAINAHFGDALQVTVLEATRWYARVAEPPSGAPVPPWELGGRLRDASAPLAWHRLMNDVMAELCHQHPDRFSMLASGHLPDAAGAAKELERSVREMQDYNPEAGFDPQRLAEAALVSIRTGRPVALDGTWRPPA